MDSSRLDEWLDKVVHPAHCEIHLDLSAIIEPFVEYHVNFENTLSLLKSRYKQYEKRTSDILDTLCDGNDEVCDLLRSGPKTNPLVHPYNIVDFKAWVKQLMTQFKYMERIIVQISSPKIHDTMYPCVIKLHSIFKQWYFQM